MIAHLLNVDDPALCHGLFNRSPLDIAPNFVHNGNLFGIPLPPAPANPPTQDDVQNAADLKAAIVAARARLTPIPADVTDAVALYEFEIVQARQISLMPPPAIPPAPGAPQIAPIGGMGGMGAVLAAINTLSQQLVTLNTNMTDLRREAAINGSRVKRSGLQHPYTEVPFLDGTKPSNPVPAVPAQNGQPAQLARAALPLIRNVDDVRTLTGPQANTYWTGHGIVQIPHHLPERRRLVGECIGCSVTVE
ncbi:hypothetical protein R3P38DRAFT_3252718 [Favolaschia claudopus]|uniref:Mug135-like C-terminal domain-containing protein n=1 Tax=Favolaschia claudopus TaxID=2862362 RepID=A0AAW0E1J2_9AGAR